MSEHLFDRPVFVEKSSDLVLEIVGIEDAIDFLFEWPEEDRDVIYQMTWKACCDAHNGLKPSSVARHAFEGFVKRRNILESPKLDMSWMAANDGDAKIPA
ncbi:DUF982 domain-containing protein [Ochrobactrum sp. RH2CCR150]|uniref:DUF982 domain-containing protein n=1 Tax=Ochrobactrum sp. RH2CCR150 TaxID=2587044 RepID=UPI0015FC8853|nr:hypothetical protein [Ochrobactrum sp. RH2CCR150]